MKRILYLSYYFPPWSRPGVKRGPRLVGGLRERGYDLLVVTKERGAKGVISLPSPEPIGPKEGIKKGGRFFYRLLKLILFPDTKLLWSILNYPRLKELIRERQIDLLITSAPPFSSLLCTYLLSLTTGKPYIVDLRDPWVDTPLLYESNLLGWLHRWGERRSLGRARLIITINDRITNNLKERYPGLKVETILHGFEPDDFRGLKPKRGDKFRIGWVGTLTRRRTPRFILEALSQMKDRNWELILVGRKWIDVVGLVAKYGLKGKVKLIPEVDYPEALRLMATADLLWFMVGRGRGAQYVSTSKLSDYLGTGRPILATIPDCAAKDLLKGLSGVRITEPDDVKGIQKELRELYRLWERKRLPHLLTEEIAPYRMDRVAQRLTEHLLELSLKPPRHPLH